MNRSPLLALLACSLSAWAGLSRAEQGVDIIVTPDTVQPVAGTTVKVTFKIDIPCSNIGTGQATDTDPRFELTISGGRLAYSEGSNVTAADNTSFIVPRNASQTRATGSATYNLTLGDPVRPGEITIAAVGSQGLRVLGVANNREFRGVGKLVVVQASGEMPPITPPITPPIITPTKEVVGIISPEMLGGLAALAALIFLGGAGLLLLGQLGGGSPSPAAAGAGPSPLPPVQPGPFPTSPAPAPPAPRPPSPAPSPPARPSVAIKDLPPKAPASKTPPKAVRPEVKVRDLPGSPPLQSLRADRVVGSQVTYPNLPPEPYAPFAHRLPKKPPRALVEVELLVSPGTIRGDGIQSVVLTAQIKPGAPLDAVISGTGFRCHQFPHRILSQGNATAVCSIDWKIAWQWNSGPLTFEAQTTVLVPGEPRRFIVVQSEPVQVQGADPKLHVISSLRQLDGVGRDGTELTATLELFGEQAPLEKVDVQSAVGTLGGRDWDRLDAAVDPATGVRRVQWIAPFFLARPGKESAEVMIEVSGRWWGGPLFDRASKPIPPLTDTVQVRVDGCIVIQKPSPERFLPVPETVLQVEARLARRGDRPMRSPFEGGALHDRAAGIECHLEDRTQGRIPKPAAHGCTIPPDPPSPGVKRTLPVPAVTDTGKIWTPRKPDDRRPRRPTDPASLDLLLAEHTPRPEHEPIHGAPLLYSLVVRDGMGDPVVAEGACRVALETLVLETGGLDFTVYEYRPHTFLAQLDKAVDPASALARETWRLVWEFAVVDEKGNPVASGGRFATFPRSTPSTAMPLTIGHWRRNEQVERVDLAGASLAPPSEEDYLVSLVARRRWHSVAERHGRDEEGLTWARTETPDGAWNSSPWRDRVLFMAVRVELRTADNHLLGTSDRVVGELRTPPAFVWGNHMFRYALTKVRFNLQDARGLPYASRMYRWAWDVPDIRSEVPSLQHRIDPASYQVAMGNFPPPPRDERSSAAGLLESVVAVGAERGTVAFLPGDGVSPYQPWCEIEFDLGDLPPVDQEEGVRARLENLGLCPGPDAADPRFHRALQRFQVLSGLTPDGVAAAETRRRLEEADRMGLVERTSTP